MILVDYREGSKELLAPLRKMGLPAESGDIPADLAWEGRGPGGSPLPIGIEYKKLGELIQSFRTERFQGHQVPKMAEEFKRIYLLFEGEIHVDPKGLLCKRVGARKFVPYPGRMSYNELHKRLLTLYDGWGLLTAPPTRTQAETLKWIEACYRHSTDEDQDAHTSHIAIYMPPTPTPISEFRKMFKGIDDIGLVTTKAIETHFSGSVRRAVVAGRNEWLTIPGIGPKLWAHIDAVLEGRRK